jgi:hypothetical protein
MPLVGAVARVLWIIGVTILFDIPSLWIVVIPMFLQIIPYPDLVVLVDMLFLLSSDL